MSKFLHEETSQKDANKSAEFSRSLKRKKQNKLNYNQQMKTFIFITVVAQKPVVLREHQFLTDPQPMTTIPLLAQQSPLISVLIHQKSLKGVLQEPAKPRGPTRELLVLRCITWDKFVISMKTRVHGGVILDQSWIH